MSMHCILCSQARLEGDLHVSSLGSALKRRATMVEHSRTEAPSHPLQQQPTQAQQQGSSPQQQSRPQHTSFMQGGGSSAGGHGGGDHGGDGHGGSDDEYMQDASPPEAASAQGGGGVPEGAQSLWATAAPWACAVKCSTVAEVRRHMPLCSTALRQWSGGIAYSDAKLKSLQRSTVAEVGRHMPR
eukprot:1149713-Pelagomonas_calceolata.AAC.5